MRGRPGREKGEANQLDHAVDDGVDLGPIGRLLVQRLRQALGEPAGKDVGRDGGDEAKRLVLARRRLLELQKVVGEKGGDGEQADGVELLHALVGPGDVEVDALNEH